MERPPRTPRQKFARWVLVLLVSAVVTCLVGSIPQLIEGNGFNWDMLQIMLTLVTVTASQQWDRREEWLFTSAPRTTASDWNFATARPQIVGMVLVVCASALLTALFSRAPEKWLGPASWQVITLKAALAVTTTLANYWTWGRRFARPKPDAPSRNPA